jgi:type I restriction enzyme M protein
MGLLMGPLTHIVMTAELPKWVEARYTVLWDAFKDSSFRMEDASKVLVEKNKDRWEQVPVYLSELRKAGWLLSVSDAGDARRKSYRLVSRAEAIKGIMPTEGTLTRSDVEAILKKAADLIRTRVDYKFILILLFLKRMSDKWEVEFEQAYKEALADGFSKEEATREAEKATYHTFDLPEEYLWDNLRKDVVNLPEKMSRALKVIGERNPELKDVVDSVDFIQFTSSTENAEILRQLVELFSEKKLHKVSPDILGDAYEWILRYFAPSKAKEGEIYTPREVIQLLVEILNPQPGESVYDPACGSAGMLISAYKHVEEQKGKDEAQKLFLYGQEANDRTIALAKMNMYIHDIRDSNLLRGDTFLYPKFKEGDGLKKFDVVLANPPWNQDGYDEGVLKKGEFWQQRFRYGFGPKQSADWAWIQHMLASAKDRAGRVAIIVDNGCLFRGGKEDATRSKILEADLIESVVLLPERLFYNTGAPGAIIILRKTKSPERRMKILFINASSEFEQHPEVRKLNRLGADNISRIVGTHTQFRDEKGFSRVVSLDEVRGNEFNLNVSLYVTPASENESIDIHKEFSELKTLERERQDALDKLERYILEISEVKD